MVESRSLRVMADANILIAGLLFPRWFHEFLRHALKEDFRLVLCMTATTKRYLILIGKKWRETPIWSVTPKMFLSPWQPPAPKWTTWLPTIGT